jgi:hypothetical protein
VQAEEAYLRISVPMRNISRSLGNKNDIPLFCSYCIVQGADLNPSLKYIADAIVYFFVASLEMVCVVEIAELNRE